MERPKVGDRVKHLRTGGVVGEVVEVHGPPDGFLAVVDWPNGYREETYGSYLTTVTECGCCGGSGYVESSGRQETREGEG